jgi:hypothetical protein
MNPVQPTRAIRAGFVAALACLATLAVALAACRDTNQPAGPAVAASTGSPSATSTVVAQSAAPTVVTPTPRPVSTLPPPAHRPQTVHVLEDPVSFHAVTVAGCTSAAGCEGDQLIGTSRMLDADTRVTIGSLAVSCILIDPGKNRYHCPANTITLTGRGQIVFDETFNLGGPWDPVPWPITSGTGEFLGATGSVTSPEDSTWSYGDFVISITG